MRPADRPGEPLVGEADVRQRVQPRWASRPLRDVVAIVLLTATGAACGLLLTRAAQDWVGWSIPGYFHGRPAVDLTPDGTRVAVAWSNGLVTVYDTATGEQVFASKTPGHPCSVALSRNSASLAVGCKEGRVAFWAEGKSREHLGEETRGATALAFSSDACILACWREETLTAWAIPDRKSVV